MIPAWTGHQVREAEKPLLEAGQGPVLMQRAAYALALECLRELRSSGRVPGARVVILAGTGNNGGDALWAATHLRTRGAAVSVIATGDRLHPDGEAAARAAGVSFMQLSETGVQGAAKLCLQADLILDGVLGTGARGGLRDPMSTLVTILRDHLAELPVASAQPTVVAVDIASGVEADSGAAAGPVLTATRTVTFGGTKVGHVVAPGTYHTGHLSPVPIGIESHLPLPEVVQIEPSDVDDLWPRPTVHDHKYTRGVVGVVAGSPQYPGAALLCTRSAVAAGAGMVRYVGDSHTQSLVTLTSPEVVSSADDPSDLHVQSWVAGPGAVDDVQRDRIRTVVDLDDPAVLDAGALEVVGQLLGDRKLSAHHILTPHAGELAQLLQWCQAWGLIETAPSREEIQDQALTWARVAAQSTGATVLLKGAVTVVASPSGGPAFVVGHGSPWLSTAGSGDCLAGILGTLVAHAAGGPQAFSRAIQHWAQRAPLAGAVRKAFESQLQDQGRWALVAAVAAGFHASASRVDGEGPQPCSPDHIRAVLTRRTHFSDA